MRRLILIWLFATGRCAENNASPSVALSLLQKHAEWRAGGASEDLATTRSAAGNEKLTRPTNVVTSVEDIFYRHVLHKSRDDVWHQGCFDPAATNYGKSDGCYYGTQAPDWDYSFSANQRMHPNDALVMYQIGHIVGKLFDKYDIRWWITDGSLLGSLRNGGIIPHDDDVDLNVLVPQVPFLKTDTFRNELHLNGLHLDDEQHEDRIYIWNYTEWQRLLGGANERGTRMKLDLWPLEYKNKTWRQTLATEHYFPGDLCQALYHLPTDRSNTNDTFQNYSCQLERRSFGLDNVWAPSRSTSVEYLAQRYGDWNSAPECVGTLHDCHLIANLSHDMLRYAEPAGPLRELAPMNSQSLLCNSRLSSAVVLIMLLLVLSI